MFEVAVENKLFAEVYLGDIMIYVVILSALANSVSRLSRSFKVT